VIDISSVFLCYGNNFTTLSQDGEFWECEMATARVKAYFHSSRVLIPAELDKILEDHVSAAALGGMVSYLRKLNLDSELITTGRFLQLSRAGTAAATHMILDAQALSDLQILDCGTDRPSCGNASSLLQYLDHCRTGFGRR
jgi:DNA mismatch repair ATPase MutS